MEPGDSHRLHARTVATRPRRLAGTLGGFFGEKIISRLASQPLILAGAPFSKRSGRRMGVVRDVEQKVDCRKIATSARSKKVLCLGRPAFPIEGSGAYSG
jgi:hypothetical protein